MATNVQQLPSWMTYSTTVITDAAGDPIATSTTILTLPLTYYGPSVPLGTDGVWTWGGLTSPASTTAPASQTTASTPTVTATPSSATPTSSTTSRPSSSRPSSSSSSSSSSSQRSSSSPSSTSSLPTASSTSTASRPFPRGLIGAIVGSIVGALLLLLLLLLCLRWRTRRRQSQYSHTTPIWVGWEIVDPSTGANGAAAGNQARPREVPPDRVQSPGEGSPRHSGEEHDPFLSRPSDVPSTGAAPLSPRDMELMKELGPGVRLVSHPGAPAIARTTRRQRLKNSPNYNPETDEETEAEGVGEFGRRRSVLYLDPDTGDAYWGNSGDYTPSSSGSSKPSVGRQILSTREQYRIESESDQSRHGHSNVLRQDSPLLPAAPIDPEGLTMPARKGSLRAMASMDSARDEELAELLTARRVRVSDLPSPPNSPQAEEEMSAGPSSWLGAAGLARLRRISFFKRESPLRNTSPMSSKAGSRPVSFQVSPLGDRDVEAGQALLKAEMGVRDGARPISTVSGKSAVSGGTMYHDAASRPQSAVPGSFPSSYRTAQTHPQESQGSRVPATPAVEEVPEIPPVPSLPGESHMQEFSDVSETQPSGTDESHGGLSPGVDILDLPAPSAEESFSTTANRSRKDLVFPPGLSSSPLPNHWDSAQTPSEEIDSYHGHNLHAPAAVDVLEEEPPRAGEGWRSLASGAGGGDRRTTFGSVGNPTVVHPRDITHSEQGSLHSMRSHLSPFSSRSPSGSAAASSPSSRHMLIGSGSSRGTHSQGPSGSSGGSHSLGHSGSISSDSRRRGRRDASDINAPPPPIGRVSLGATGRGVASPLYQMTPQPTAGAGDDHAVVSSTVTTKATASTATTGSSMTDPVTGAVMHFPTVPWTGADSDWPADAWIEMPGRGGRRLGGPPSQWRSLQTRIGDAEAERRS